MRPSGAGLGNMSGQECTFSYMYTGQLPPGQVPLWTSSPRTSSPGRQASKKDKFPPDNFPPDKFPYGQVPPGQVPLAGKHLKRTTSPRTSSTSDKFPPGGSCPGGTCLLAPIIVVKNLYLLPGCFPTSGLASSLLSSCHDRTVLEVKLLMTMRVYHDIFLTI